MGLLNIQKKVGETLYQNKYTVNFNTREEVIFFTIWLEAKNTKEHPATTNQFIQCTSTVKQS